jgi:hypothetical protein
MRNPPIFFTGDLCRGYAQAEEAGINIRKGFFDRRVIQIIIVNEHTKFFVGEAKRTPSNRANLLDGGRREACPQNTATSGTACAKDKNIHSLYSFFHESAATYAISEWKKLYLETNNTYFYNQYISYFVMMKAL